MKLGYAEVDITPQTVVETVGFGREDNSSRGILKPLLAQVTVWEETERYCLVTIDSLGFKKDLSDHLRQRICHVLSTSFKKVMVCFSHCHSAPNAAIETEYYEMVCSKLEEAAISAQKHLYEVYVGYGNASVDIGVNRRQKTGALDKRAGILKVCKAESGKNALLIIRVTAHCNVLKSDNYLISPDYFGDIRELLKKQYACPVMVIQGSAGNIAPKYFQSSDTPVDATGELYIRSKNGLNDMAMEVLRKTAPIIDKIEVTRENALGMSAKQFTLYANVPEYETAVQIAREAKENCGIDGNGWLAEIKKLNDNGVKKQEESVEVQYFTIGDWCFCGVPYELMEGFAIRAKEMLHNEFFYLNGYTNGCLTYFPTEDEFDYGGYEVYWSMLIYYIYFDRVAPFVREAATDLVRFAVRNAPVWEH